MARRYYPVQHVLITRQLSSLLLRHYNNPQVCREPGNEARCRPPDEGCLAYAVFAEEGVPAPVDKPQGGVV
eukprot:CAMPEP_0173415036 /NCGR_PEP_ID=MMETSP1356-20130122/84646_1 /TAXON_ID=77927 ORGANISM="Hemiselmis virescens, Strain PCC157" /NCGR_SAMPLE_ID=MMETSP1356 /ASSEMBLY_ACC=CAM_ASM_000847 /LENGTH=70 /DNA_ID=CAMNT_0014377259 /DNA_START=1270 /DNA_END=1478 /DNA_ORIENTATION=+